MEYKNNIKLNKTDLNTLILPGFTDFGITLKFGARWNPHRIMIY